MVAKIIDKIRLGKKEKEEVVTEEKKQLVCKACGRSLDKAEVVANKYVCYECGYYFRVKTKNRLKMVADPQSFTPWFEDLESKNPLNFPDYEEKLKAVQEKTGLHEGVTVGKGKIYGEDAVIGVCDARFLMGSMGHVVGEKIAAAVERATKERLPVILVLLLRRSQNAGGNHFADADGKDLCRFKKAFGCGTFICAGADRPD